MGRPPSGCTGISPAIDAANNAICAAAPVDSRIAGLNRPVDGDLDGSAICDIGAFEHQAGSNAVNVTLALPATINLKSKALNPVAILSTPIFDATNVDFATVRFGPNGGREAHGEGHLEDVDKDRDLDLVLHFHIQDSGIACGQTTVTLTGTTYNGTVITGTAPIRTSGCR